MGKNTLGLEHLISHILHVIVFIQYRKLVKLELNLGHVLNMLLKMMDDQSQLIFVSFVTFPQLI